MKHLTIISLVMVLVLILVGCAQGGNEVSQQQLPTENKSAEMPAALPDDGNQTTQIVQTPTAQDTFDINDALDSTVLIFSTAQWQYWEAADGFWYGIEMLKPIISSRTMPPIHWTQHQNKREWKQGSGVIIDNRGYILTSRSVIEDCDFACEESLSTVGNGAQFIYVFLCENGEVQIDREHCYIATVICKHPQDDLAIIKITPRNGPLPYVQIDSSFAGKRGQQVMALGYPNDILYIESFSAYKWKTDTIGFYCEPTITNGIISSMRRYDTYPMNYSMDELNKDYRVNVIQTNADVNSGNSGGPLIDESGHIVGIVIAKVFGAAGLGFAISINESQDLINNALSMPLVGINDGTFIECEPGSPCYSQSAWESSSAKRCHGLCNKYSRGNYTEKCYSNTR